MDNRKVALFEKVSFKQYLKDYLDLYPNSDEKIVKEIYDNIKLPIRATSGSAGYDFFMPYDLSLSVNTSIKVLTGIRVKINDGWFLAIFPRSGLGFKYRFQLDNTVGIIDSDYYNALNEGHIIIKVCNDSNTNKDVSLKASDGFAQGIFLPFGLTINDDTNNIRTGGFGSTSNNGK